MADFLSPGYGIGVSSSIDPSIYGLVGEEIPNNADHGGSRSVTEFVEQNFKNRLNPQSGFFDHPLATSSQFFHKAASSVASGGAHLGLFSAKRAASITGASQALKAQSQTQAQIKDLVGRVSDGFLNPFTTGSIVFASYHRYLTLPIYNKEDGFPESAQSFIGKYIIPLSILDRTISFGLSLAFLAGIVVRLATTALAGVATLFSWIGTSLTGTKNNWCRDQLIVQLSHLAGLTALFGANFVGVFDPEVRDLIVLETANAFSDRDLIANAIQETHLV